MIIAYIFDYQISIDFPQRGTSREGNGNRHKKRTTNCPSCKYREICVLCNP